MSVTVRDDLQAVGAWQVDIDYTPEVKALLVDDDNYHRPRNLHALIYDALVGGSLVCPPLVLLRASGDDKGITIGGVGPLWHLGAEGVGPMITDDEKVSGEDKLDNGTFDLDDLYWRLVSEGSLWVLLAGTATNVGGLGKDDVLEVDRKFPTRPGYTYRATAHGVTGTGSLRVRTLYEGRFAPPNILANWLGVDSLTIGPITKPQLIAGWDFGSSAGWTLGPTMSITGGSLIAGPNPRPEYIADSGFETGTGWTDVIGPAAVPMSDDIDLVNLPAEAANGNWVMQVGPVTQHQVLANSDMESGLTNWYVSSTTADPDPGVFFADAGGGLDASASITTDGVAFLTRLVRYLRADSGAGAGVQAYDVRPGEQYLAEAHIRAAPGTNGTAYMSLHIPHPTVANRERWYVSPVMDGPKSADDVFRRVAIDLAIPANRFKLDALFEVHDCTTGEWAVDNFTITRTRGNRAQIQSDLTYTVVPKTKYGLTALMRSGGEMQVGSVRVGVILYGPTVDVKIVDVDKGSTDYEWTIVEVELTPDDGYVYAVPFVAALDIVGDPAWIDNIQLTKLDNNTDTSVYTAVTVVPDQRYLLQVDAEVQGATEGTLTVGVALSGPAVANEYITVQLGVKGNVGVNALSAEVRPGPGYNAATLYVKSTDILGGNFAIHQATLTKMDNNTAATAGTTLAVTPERTYRWTQDTRSGVALQRGTTKLSVTCLRTGYPDRVFESSAMEATDGDVKQIVFDFTPPSGYDQIAPSIIGTDVEGDSWYLGSGAITDTDTGTAVFDTVSSNPAGASPFVDTTAPDGAESVRVQVVVEQGSTSWTVNSVSFKRTGVTPATAAAIVADLLEDPDTGLPLSLVAGTITAPAVIPYDWVIQNRTNREALDHLVNVVADPPLVYRVLATDPPSIDVGPAATVFTTHAQADALLPEDIDVEDLSNPEVDVEDRATVIRVIGADRQTVSGRPFLVTADAVVPGYNGNPIVRTKIVSDGTVDHQGYAAAYASDLAAHEAKPPRTVTVKISGKATRADSPPGDTIWLWEPEAGLENDPTVPGNAVDIEGQTAFPTDVQVHLRERVLGPSHRIEMRGSDGTTFTLPGVLWSAEDATVLTVGDRLPSWVADPQAQSTGTQYLRDRASRPR